MKYKLSGGFRDGLKFADFQLNYSLEICTKLEISPITKFYSKPRATTFMFLVWFNSSYISNHWLLNFREFLTFLKSSVNFDFGLISLDFFSKFLHISSKSVKIKVILF